MTKRIFAVILDNPEKGDVPGLLSSIDQNFHQVADNIFLVAADVLAGEVATMLGMKRDNEDERVSGAVFKLNSAYAGYTSRSLWEWLGQHEE